ncbi:MAG TPA: SEC-C metal-binding domain-containing protein [Bryobacteraceae bacterium]|nr:SEC-C metal-binding domain-containing protein [Bryobacteraceae bacterium]
MTDAFPLSPIQEQVLDLIAAGATAMDAARQSGVHRNTVQNWLRREDFQAGLREARARKELFFRDQAETLAAKAIAGLMKLSDDPLASPSVRLKACIILLEKAILFMPESSAVVLPESPEATSAAPAEEPEPPADPPAPAASSDPEIVHSVHNCAQPAQPVTPRPPASADASSRKIGRNKLCPCGSGLKYKRCCIGKTPLQSA